jgi:hypothetical protein
VKIVGILLLLAGVGHGQVSWREVPRTLQLYGHATTADTGTVVVSGTVDRVGTPFTEIHLKVSRNGVLQSTLKQTLAYSGDTARFAFSKGIKAELANYRFEVLGLDGTVDSSLWSADSVVCGDVIVIQGQSNAEACAWVGSADTNQSPFIRVFGDGNDVLPLDTVWRIGEGDVCSEGSGGTGQWGLRLARELVDSARMPVAVFNGAKGGEDVAFFQPNLSDRTDSTTNYGRLLQRLRMSGSDSSVHALVWHQGEANAGIGTSTPGYMSQFLALRSQWRADFPTLGRIYLFQIRNGCGFAIPEVAAIQEAQRELALGSDSVEIMSTSGEDHFNDCHYPYEPGYRDFGDDIFRLVQRDFHGRASLDNIEPPQVKFAEVTGARQVTLIMANVFDSLTWSGAADSEFALAGTSAKFDSGSVLGNKVRLNLSAAAGGISAITYLGHENSADPLVTNHNRMGMVHFANFPITTAWQRDSICVAAILAANSLKVSVASVVTRNSGGRAIALNLHAAKLSVLPADIVYMDSLKTLNLGSNSLSILPRETNRLPPGIVVNVDSNFLCQLPDSTAAWIGKHASDALWRGAQKCPTTEIRAPAAPSAADPVKFRVSGRDILVQLSDNADPVDLQVRNLSGSLVYSRHLAAGSLTIDAASWGSGLHILRIASPSGVQVVRFPLL